MVYCIRLLISDTLTVVGTQILNMDDVTVTIQTTPLFHKQVVDANNVTFSLEQDETQ
jgi:hypothetical protein